MVHVVVTINLSVFWRYPLGARIKTELRGRHLKKFGAAGRPDV
jgi:hypothetical protein